MKRTVAFLLVAVMLLGTIPFASAGMDNFQKTQSYSAQFADVKSSDWFAAGVQSAYELGLMKGSSDTAFKPTGNLTVAEALAIACRLHSIYAANGESFTQGNPWYQVYVDYAVANKIMTAGQLDPKNTITREQFAYLMCGAIPSADLDAINTITEIPDEKADSTYGSFVYRLYNAGVLTGSDKYGTFKPTTAIQRSEVATIVTRMADRGQRKTVKLEAKPAVTEIQLAGKVQITVGESTTWTAKTLPEGTNEKVTWAAGNPGVATVDGSGNIKGIKAGQCNITARTANGVTKTVLLTVGEIAVTGINLAGKTNVAIGGSTKWTASVVPANASNQKLTWKAGNPGVATVDQSGNIKGIKAGQCNITVSAVNGVSKTVMVTVSEGGSLKNPYDGSEGALVEYRWTDEDPVCLMRIKVNNIYHGSEVNRILSDDDYFIQRHSKTAANQEWRLYEYEVEYVDCKSALSPAWDMEKPWPWTKKAIPADPNFKPDIGQLLGVRNRYYTANGASVPAYDDYGVAPIYGSTYVSLFKGASSKVYYGILVDKDVGTLLLGVERVKDGTVSDLQYTFISLNAPTVPASSTSENASQNNLQNTAFDTMVTYAKSHSGVFASAEDTEAEGISRAKITSQYSIRYDAAKDAIVLSGTTDAKRKQPRSFTYDMTIPRKHSGTFSGLVNATETNDSDTSKSVTATGTIKIRANDFPFGNGYGYDVEYNSYSGDSVKAQLAATSNEITALSMVTMAQWYYHDMLKALNETILKPAGHNANEFGFKYYN